jgi:hypothetical protein
VIWNTDTYHSALADPNWRAAMVEEHDALLKNHTWDLVPHPPRANIVTGKWIFKHKFTLTGLWSATKRVGYFGASLNTLVWTVQKPSVQWSSLPSFELFSLCHSPNIALFISWM